MNGSLYFLTIPALYPSVAQQELNQFIQKHRVAAIEKEFVADGASSYWSLCITVLEGEGTLPAALRAPGSVSAGKSTPKIDYREVLNEADFAVYADLRNLRASIAKAEGVPPYALFSNEQLACMVRGRVVTAGQLREIDGVGEARVNKYATHFLPLLRKAFASSSVSTDAGMQT